MKKDQFVALCADSLQQANQLIPVVKPLAESLRKGIILFTTSSDGDSWVHQTGLPFAVLKSDWATVVESMPTAFNVVLAVALVNPDSPRSTLSHPRQFLKSFREAKIAYLAVPAIVSELQFLTVALTLNHQRESKEKLIWASYLERFCRSNVVVYHHPYSDPAFRLRLNNNIRYLEKTFASLGLSFELQELPQGSQFGDPDLKAIRQPEIDLFISLVADARERDLLDFFTPPPPLKLIRKAPQTPILFLNQRDDLYIMCD